MFVHVPSGSCSIAIYHDKNNTSRLDTGEVDIPTELMGVSTNKRGLMRLFSFEKSQVSLSEKLSSLEILLQ